jgi:two-component system C4-dicarboxylate transport sensor histidine kinase DctB
VAESAAKRVEVSIECCADKIVINVRDSGPGIDESALPKLFEPYFTTKDIGEGLGLGLAICYGIVKDHGGTIVAEGRAEGGAQFAVTLPRVSMEVAS